jgi:hypothetical protein
LEVGSVLVDVIVDDDDELLDAEDDKDVLLDDDETELDEVDEDPSSEQDARLKPATVTTPITVRRVNPVTRR